jgi:starch phosphorylase
MDTRWRFLTTGSTSTHGKPYSLWLAAHNQLINPHREFPRHDVTVDIQFYGNVRKYQDESGKQISVWENGEHVTAVAYDAPIPGYGTTTTNNLRLWSSKASHGEFDFTKFNSGEYEQSVAETQRAETISAVLYPNDSLDRGKELRLKQQYFWCAASLFDIVRRFKKSKKAWKEFPNAVAIQVSGLPLLRTFLFTTY